MSDIQSMKSIQTINTIRTIDREKLRIKARIYQMKENLRLEISTRIQKLLRKNPKVAEEIATQVIQKLNRKSKSKLNTGPTIATLNDQELIDLVHEICAMRTKQQQLAMKSSSTPIGDQGVKEVEQVNTSYFIKEESSRSLKSMQRKRMKSKEAMQYKYKPTLNDTTEDTSMIYMTEAQILQQSTGFQLPPRISPQNRSQGIWEDIVKHASMEEEQEKEKIKQAKVRAREELTKKLDEQVKLRQELAVKEQAKNQEYYQLTLQNLEKQDKEQHFKDLQNQETLKVLSASQIAEREAKLCEMKKQKERKRIQEQNQVALILKQQKDDQLRELKKKQAEKEHVAKVLLENERQLAFKKQQKQKDQQYEQQLTEEYIKMEQEKEEQRRKQLQDMADNIKGRMKYYDDHSKADMDAKLKEEEDRVRNYQEQYEQKLLERDQAKKQAAEKANIAQQTYLRQQMLEKKEREKAMKRDLRMQGEIWKKQQIEAERLERKQIHSRNIRNKIQQNILLQQIEEKQQKELVPDQSQVEIQINTQLLKKIQQDIQKPMVKGALIVTETQNRSHELDAHEINYVHSHETQIS